MKTKVIPSGDRILIRRDPAEKQSKGGILLPDNAKQKPRKGEVIAVGPGRRLDSGERLPVSYHKGQTVLFNVYGQHDVPDEDGLLLVREEDILAVLEG